MTNTEREEINKITQKMLNSMTIKMLNGWHLSELRKARRETAEEILWGDDDTGNKEQGWDGMVRVANLILAQNSEKE